MKKKTHYVKARVLKLAFASASLILVLTTLGSCNNAKRADPKDVATEHNDAKFDNKGKDDAKFLVKAAEINLEEIQLGKLAQTRGTALHVSELGKMMVTEHTKAMADLQILAAKKQITIPTTITDNGMESNKRLMDTKASNFDKEYADMMVSGHKDAISKFESASTDAKDADIRNWASSMLPALRKHLDHSITCQKECEKK